MKAITLTQPWATLVAMGAKQVETRSWSTTYRGPLAIHAAKGYPKWARELCGQEPFKSILMRAPLMGLPDPGDSLGMVLCICDLWACKPVEQVSWTLSVTELAFGDYSPGRYAWGLRVARVLDSPIPTRGALGLWEWQQEAQQTPPYIHINGDPDPETREALVTAMELLRQQLIDQQGEVQP